MSYKEITRESYEATAEAFTRYVEELTPLESIQKFITLLPPRAKVLDIGCGSAEMLKYLPPKDYLSLELILVTT